MEYFEIHRDDILNIDVTKIEKYATLFIIIISKFSDSNQESFVTPKAKIIKHH